MKTMKKLLVLTAVICLAFSVITGCTDTKITSDSPKKIEVVVGESFVVSLAENPSTGFSWHYRIADQGVIALISDAYIHGGSNLPGSGGQHNWKFKALKKGSSKIIFSYYREWEKDKVASNYEYTVTVK